MYVCMYVCMCLQVLGKLAHLGHSANEEKREVVRGGGGGGGRRGGGGERGMNIIMYMHTQHLVIHTCTHTCTHTYTHTCTHTHRGRGM